MQDEKTVKIIEAVRNINHVHYVTGGRLKAASLILVFRTLLPVGHSRID